MSKKTLTSCARVEMEIAFISKNMLYNLLIDIAHKKKYIEVFEWNKSNEIELNI